jgi:hypothetical protein
MDEQEIRNTLGEEAAATVRDESSALEEDEPNELLELDEELETHSTAIRVGSRPSLKDWACSQTVRRQITANGTLIQLPRDAGSP